MCLTRFTVLLHPFLYDVLCCAVWFKVDLISAIVIWAVQLYFLDFFSRSVFEKHSQLFILTRLRK